MSRKKEPGRHWFPSFTSPLFLLLVLCAGVLIAAAVRLSRSKSIELPYLTASNVAVMNANTGRFVAEADGDMPHSPGSLTKMMTVYLVLDDIERGALDWDDIYTVTEHEAFTPGSKYGMMPGDVFTVRELVAGTIMVSGCDCVQCLVQLCASDETAFVERMNEKAQELGLKGSHFANATGIDAAAHYMTARDIAALACRLVKDHPEILDFTASPSLTIGERTFRNIHKLVGSDNRVKGLKTGTTKIGGYNVCTYAEQNEQGYVIVLLDSASDYTRFAETVTVMDILWEDA